MNIIAMQLFLAMAAVGQIGGSLSLHPPVSTIAALSLPATDESPAMVLRVYRLRESTEEDPHPTAEELVPLVRDLFAEESWQAEGAYLRAVNNRLLMRQTAQVQREIHALLLELDAIHGGSYIPIVGERRDDGRRQERK